MLEWEKAPPPTPGLSPSSLKEEGERWITGALQPPG